VRFDFAAPKKRVQRLARHGQSYGVAAHRVDAFDSRLVSFADGNLVVEFERNAERVKAGTQIGGGGRHANGNRRFPHWHCDIAERKFKVQGSKFKVHEFGQFAMLPAMLEMLFKLRERGSSVRVEVIGGATTFVTMAYIIVVNPAILAAAGIPVGPSTVATILSAVFGCLLMGVYANRPIAVAPYMGENAFIAFGLTALGIGWQLRLGAVFVSGVGFILITVLKIRSWLANSISASTKHSFAVGIGLFLAFIGLFETGIVVKSEAVPVQIGNLRDPGVLLAVVGFLLICVLMLWRVRGAILLGIAATAVLGYVAGIGERPHSVMAWPPSIEPIAFEARYCRGVEAELPAGLADVVPDEFSRHARDVGRRRRGREHAR